jgi:hypothetical protein
MDRWAGTDEEGQVAIRRHMVGSEECSLIQEGRELQLFCNKDERDEALNRVREFAAGMERTILERQAALARAEKAEASAASIMQTVADDLDELTALQAAETEPVAAACATFKVTAIGQLRERLKALYPSGQPLLDELERLRTLAAKAKSAMTSIYDYDALTSAVAGRELKKIIREMNAAAKGEAHAE